MFKQRQALAKQGENAIKLKLDTLKCAKMLTRAGISSPHAATIVSTLAKVVIWNIYDKQEVENMICKGVQEILDKADRAIEARRRETDRNAKKYDMELKEQRRRTDKELEKQQRESERNAKKHDKALEVRRRESEARLAQIDKRIEQELIELRASRRWLGGIIISCTIALAGYLSALIHITH